MDDQMFPRAFTLSWIAYFGFYLCRKNFSVLMPYLKSETGMSSNDLATALFAYSLLYAIGQFAMGRAADKVGARRVAGIGMLVSAGMSALMAWPAWLGIAGVLVVLQGINGAAQAGGWPSVLKMAREWFPVENRGVILGWWSTHMVLGGFAGTWLAAACAEAHWTRAAWLPSIVLSVIAVVFLIFAQDKDAHGEKDSQPAPPRAKLAVTRPLVAIAAMYFCVKVTRYSFLFWLPLYMTEYLHYAKPLAGYSSSVFELIGILGALGTGYVSEKLGGPRFAVGAVMMITLGILCATYPAVSSFGFMSNIVWIGLIGMFTFGPDTLMAAAALQDVVPPESTASAAGFVNGIGSVGQVLSPFAVSYLSSHFGWASLFGMLSVVVLLGGVALSTQCLKFFELKQETA